MYCLIPENLPTLDVRLSNDTGEIIHVYPCTKRMAEKLVKLKELPENEKMASLYSAVAVILSKNREKRTVTEEELEDVPITALAAFLQEYTMFLGGMAESPN